MHIAMLLGAAEILKKHEDEIHGQVKLIFQPGEEKLPGGASLMIEEGILKDPKPEVIFGQHILPEETTGTIAISDGYVMASTDEIYLTLTSKGSHAAQPQLSGDPILAAAQIVNHIQTLVTKFRDPLDSAVISITSFHAGTTTNIIPSEAKLLGTMRTFNKDLRAQIKKLIRENGEMIAKMHGVGFDLEIMEGYPALYNNEKAVETARSAALAMLTKENVKKFRPKMWAEDFAYYAQEIPACFWFLGIKPENMESMPPLHNAKLSPDEKALPIGAALLAQTAIDWLKYPKNDN
jgi:amidohydrolase